MKKLCISNMIIFYNFILLFRPIIAFGVRSSTSNQKYKDHPCQKGYFYTEGGICERLLNCNDMQQDIKIIEEWHGGFVKQMFLVSWKGMKLVYSLPREGMYQEDFQHGVKMMETFQGIRFFAQLVGFCYEPLQVLTRYYKYGSANHLQRIFADNDFDALQEAKLRLKLARDYLEIINFLHDSPAGCRVMCDSNSLNKTMSQFLISDDFHLILSDIDALPAVEGRTMLIKCGHRELFGSFVAPEQLWPFKSKIFDDEKMPAYDEKTDIWKVPDVIFYLLGDTSIGDRMKFMLFDKLRHCKNVIPSQRPSAKDLLSTFLLSKDLIEKELNTTDSKDEL